MRNQPNPDAEDCGCRWFESAAKDDAVPVVFVERVNEYHLLHTNGGYSLFYHCPFCGGKAPKTLRGTFWTQVTPDESLRLEALTRDIRTPEELFARFGPPDSESEISGMSISRETDETPSEVTVDPRQLIYQSLSETADVHVCIDRYDRLRFSYVGRYIGLKRS